MRRVLSIFVVVVQFFAVQSLFALSLTHSLVIHVVMSEQCPSLSYETQTLSRALCYHVSKHRRYAQKENVKVFVEKLCEIFFYLV